MAPTAHRSVALLLGLATLAGGCDRFRHELTPEKDALALGSVFLRFVADEDQAPLSLTFCEDLERAEAESADGCEVAHLARGGLRSQTDTIAHQAGGCDVCAVRNLAYVVGRLEGTALASPVDLRGTVDLGNSFRDDPYAYPYRIKVMTTAGDVSLELELRQSGKHFLRLFDGPIEASEVPRFYRAAGPASCPLRQRQR